MFNLKVMSDLFGFGWTKWNLSVEGMELGGSRVQMFPWRRRRKRKRKMSWYILDSGYITVLREVNEPMRWTARPGGVWSGGDSIQLNSWQLGKNSNTVSPLETIPTHKYQQIFEKDSLIYIFDHLYIPVRVYLSHSLV